MFFLSCPTGQQRSNSNPWGTPNTSTPHLKELIQSAMAASTRKTYRSGIKKFLKFCDQHHVCPLPVLKETVAYFAVSTSRELTPATVRVYLSAVILIHKIAGFSDPTRHNFLLKVVLKGAKRIHALKPRRKREPIMVQLLGKLPVA